MDWINPTGVKKVHSLIDKVYQRKNLEMAWEKVKANRGSGGVDGQSLEGFAAQLGQQLDRLQSELKEDVYRISERTGCAVTSAENADRACPARIRVSWIQDQARTTAASVAPGQDPQRCPAGGVICVRKRTIRHSRQYLQQRRFSVQPPRQAGMNPARAGAERSTRSVAAH